MRRSDAFAPLLFASLIACRSTDRATPPTGGALPPAGEQPHPAPPPAPAPSPTPSPPPAQLPGPCGDGAPYCAVDLTPGAAGEALSVDDDGRVLFFRQGEIHSPTDQRIYAIHDPRTGKAADVLSLPWWVGVVASDRLAMLYARYRDPVDDCYAFEVRIVAPDGTVEDLGMPPWDPASGVCHGGRITPVALAGRYAAVTWEVTSRRRAFVHVAGSGWVDLGTLGGDHAVPIALTESGDVAGVSSFDLTDYFLAIRFHPFLWRDGRMTDMQQTWGNAPRAMGRDGSVLLEQLHTPDGSLRTLRWKNGASRDLGLHPEYDSIQGLAASADGRSTVGRMRGGDASPARGFLHEDGVLYDLNSLLASHAFHVEEAVSIGGAATIAAKALAPDGTPHAVALIRQNAPSAGGGTHELPAAQILATGQRADALALDDSHVYWINQTGHGWITDYDGLHRYVSAFEVRSTPKSGGPVRVLAAGEGLSLDLAVSSTHVYFTAMQCEDAACAKTAQRLLRVNKGGGTLEVLGAGAGQIALDSSAAYVSSPDDGGRVLAYPLAGGRPLVVADQGGSGPGIAISGDDVYFDAVTAQCDFVRSVSKAGGAVSTRASSAGSMFSAMGRMKAHAGTIYFRGGTDVVLLPASSAGPIAWLRHGAGPASRADIDADAAHVYWTQSATLNYGMLACLHRTDVGARGDSCLSESIDDYTAVRADDTDVYFIRAGQILRVPK